MKDEIREILEALKPQDEEFTKAGIKEYPLVLSVKEQKILLDYITNLQEENEKLKELCNKYEEEHSTAFKLWTMKMEEMPCYEEFMNYKSRNEKTTTYYYKTLSEYNNQNKKMPDEAVEMFNLLEGNK